MWKWDFLPEINYFDNNVPYYKEANRLAEFFSRVCLPVAELYVSTGKVSASIENLKFLSDRGRAEQVE